MEDRETQTDNVYSILGGPVYNASNNTWSVSSGSVAGSLFSPANHLNVSPRIDLQLGQKNTLTLRYQFYLNNVTDVLGGSTSLPTSGVLFCTRPSTRFSWTIPQIINDRLVNETRFEYRRTNSSSSTGEHCAQLRRAGLVFWRRQRRPVLQLAHRITTSCRTSPR